MGDASIQLNNEGFILLKRMLSWTIYDFYTPRLVKYGFVEDTSKWPKPKLNVSEDDASLSIKTEVFTLKISKNPIRISIYDEDGNLIIKESERWGYHKSKRAMFEVIHSPRDEAFMGFADQGVDYRYRYPGLHRYFQYAPNG